MLLLVFPRVFVFPKKERGDGGVFLEVQRGPLRRERTGVILLLFIRFKREEESWQHLLVSVVSFLGGKVFEADKKAFALPLLSYCACATDAQAERPFFFLCLPMRAVTSL